MKAAFKAGWKRARFALTLGVVLLAAVSAVVPAFATDSGQLFATKEDNYGRLILSFPGRTTLPKYTMSTDNGVLAIVFDQPVDIMLPDVGVTLPTYLTAARMDADHKGLRLGLKQPLSFNRTEAAEKLFIDLLPTNWTGLPPPLPKDVVDLLAENARKAAILAEQQRKADEVARSKPQVTMRVGRNPTFMRLQFDWTIDTKAAFAMSEQEGLLGFEWPVPVDVTALQADLPPELTAVTNQTDKDGSSVFLTFAKGVKPRFYQESPRSFTLDFDLAHHDLPEISVNELDAKAKAERDKAAADKAAAAEAAAPTVSALYPDTTAATITPYVSTIGSTVRVVFPFEQDTPAAVFRRGNTVWMLFDTTAEITAPKNKATLDPLASSFSVIPSVDTQVVQIDLAQDRLATLGSEGRAWVLSLGDILLTPTEPIDLTRRRDSEGTFQMTADVDRPARVHEFTDPTVGDTLDVVTAYPPARGVLRNLEYVDFTALRSVHGLVIKPAHDGVAVAIESKLAVITSPGGLTVSPSDQPRTAGTDSTQANRASYIDLGRLKQDDPGLMSAHQQDLMDNAAMAEGRVRDAARLDLAQYMIANGFSYEALGVLRVLEKDLTAEDLTRKIRMTKAIADTETGRTKDALAVLNTTSLSNEADALLWRTIARADDYDFVGAKQDALAAEQVQDSYPTWVKQQFQFAAIRAAVETNDIPMAERMLDKVNFADLDLEQASLFHLLSGRVDELKGQTADALDTYGQVINADVRPSRAEAIYRTLYLLDQKGNLDLAKATSTLSAEALLWRGNPLEAAMQKMLAEFYFREGAYRLGFETVKQVVSSYPDTPPINALRDDAQKVFIDLYLNGVADKLGPVDALSLFYDFRVLTPPGARGDEMIRNLARRLVKVDLLSQAADLLQYQLTNRLKGVAQAQVAADLAVIYLADRRPLDALRVLNATRTSDISPTLTRQRRVLEARALLDGGRDELALDMLKDMDGRDVDLLRIDAHWRAKRYSQAGGLIEAMYGDISANQPLTQVARMNLIKAAVGYVLSGDQLALSGLRAKFGDAMVTSPEWPMFDYVTGAIAVDSLEFKKVAAAVSGLDSLNAFLSSYRDAYGDGGALAPLTASKPDDKVASN